MNMKHLKDNGFTLNLNENLPLLRCTEIPFQNGFSTRIGGVSHGNGLDTLDLGMGEEDDVKENRRRFANALGCDVDKMFSAKQIHSDKVATVGHGDIGSYYECDAFVTNEKGLLLTVKVADCVPILFCDREAGVIGAAHAGWRGTISGIAPETVKAMCDLGAERERIVCAIGQSIKKCCYEVDTPFVSAVKASKYGEELFDLITPKENDREHFYADLPEMNVRLLLVVGLKAENIHVAPICTSCESQTFFSHRASKGKRGLMMAGIAIPE